MSFITDKQTTDDLNLLGKYQSGSVYSLFNKVETRGGERLLEQIFRNPLTTVSAINERSSILRYFQDRKYIFPFNKESFEQAQQYLSEGTSANRLTAFASIQWKKWSEALMRDEVYGRLTKGLQATIEVLQVCSVFVQQLAGTAMETKEVTPYQKRTAQIKTILADSRLEKLLQETGKTKDFSTFKAAKYDYLLKHNLAEEMETLLNFLYELDVYIAISDVARGKGFSYAVAKQKETNILFAEDLCHPCIIGATGNRIELKQDRNLLFLTGANMAGKSTLMKSIGINLYLAHMGFPVAAEYMEFSVRDGLYSSINIADNISQGYSHFYAEVLRVKQAAELVSQGKNMLVMFDELFKGTNVKDAYDGTLEVTKAFAKYLNCLFIVSTHIIEVGEALQSTPNIMFGYMPTFIERSQPRYTYKLQPGITEDRQGMMIIQNEGILELLDQDNSENEHEIIKGRNNLNQADHGSIK